eukprot:TRINITY_DN5880_c0_g1_i1.p1 TRINITY_DN5880_c0_g1~~TRINITY_DN5880_c0_g1_i1.p1  ORF type:complete len:170 (-),score=39.32 TRINITY_DN5880_c0_g1_i1:193-702(-)
MFLLPLWAQAFPEMCFVHVVRDGRDMAYSLRGRQAGSLFDSFFCENGESLPDDLLKAQFWQRANLELYEKGTIYLKERYSLAKIEDFMDEGSRYQAGRTLLQALGMGDVLQTVEFRKALTVFSTNLGEVNPGEIYGKWKEQPAVEIQKLENEIIRGLRIFGYPLSRSSN